jgi:DNA-binding transcriptional MerR regulator
MSAQPARAYLGISEVLAQLRADFPDVSVSKIRFLETEGLLTPARSPSGYRRFSAADVDRLRYILAAQRDHYLPLRVIKERLTRLESPSATSPANAKPQGGRGLQLPAAGPMTGSTVTASPVTTNTMPASTVSANTVSANTVSANTGRLLSRSELVEAAGLTEALLTELEAFGLLRRAGRHYGPDALVVASTAVTLTAYGVEARHLRAVRAAAERETTMIESLVAPIQRQRGPGARDLAARTAGELADLVMRLHGALVEGALAEAGLGSGAAGVASGAAGVGSGAGGQQPERDRQQLRGVEGASA